MASACPELGAADADQTKTNQVQECNLIAIAAIDFDLTPYAFYLVATLAPRAPPSSPTAPSPAITQLWTTQIPRLKASFKLQTPSTVDQSRPIEVTHPQDREWFIRQRSDRPTILSPSIVLRLIFAREVSRSEPSRATLYT